MKQLWILAGGNGSGKSTFYDRFLKDKDLSFVNADKIAKEISSENNLRVSRSAQQLAMIACEQKIADGETFCFETVFSHKSKIDLIKKAKTAKYEVNFVFIHLSSSDLNKARVFQRVSSGGHDVPPDKIETRIPRSLANLKKALNLVDNAALIDNSSAQDPLKIVARIKKKKIIFAIDPLPKWVANATKSLKK